MVSFIIALSLLLLSRAQDVCIWGRLPSSGFNSLVNGLYSYMGNYNGSPYYVNTINGNSQMCAIVGDHYLYYNIGTNRWIIGPTLGGSMYAYCDAASPSTPSCAQGWEVFNGAWEIDTNIYVTDNQCPEWNCDGISVSGSTTSACDGYYEAVDGTQNAFKQTGIDRWIYFSPSFFYWVCNTALEPTTCPISYDSRSEEGWEELDPSESVMKGDLGNIQCLSSPTYSPTTASPITSRPTTAAPTTFRPTTASPTSSQPSKSYEICLYFHPISSCL